MIWPFKTTKSKVPPFQGLRFKGADGHLYEYKPTKTISPYDAALLWPLAMTETIMTDRWAYICANKLEKHFKLVKPEDE